MLYVSDDFEPNSSSEDDEETIDKEEDEADQPNNTDEIERLKRESELPLEDLIKDLPEDYWNNRDEIDSNIVNNYEVSKYYIECYLLLLFMFITNTYT